jgi:hypothetical protein
MANDPFSSNPPNPYGPSSAVSSLSNEGPISLPPGIGRGMVNQVPIVGVLMIVQGVLDVLIGIGIAFYAFFMPMFFEEMQRQAAAQGNNAQPMPPEMGAFLSIGLGLLSFVIVLVGALTIFSGIRLIRYQSRSLGIAMLCAGMVTIVTCYCFPTSLALAVYGMIVLLSPPVRLAFDLRDQGHDVTSIQRAFLSIS